MPRPALKNVSTAALQAELARRADQLGKLLKIRDDVDRQIAGLNAIAGQFGKAVVEAPAKLVRAYRRRKAKVAKVVAKTVAAAKGKLGQYAQTASEFVLGLLASGKTLASKELGQAWAAAGRNGAVDNTLTLLVKATKLKRQKIKGQRGSNYTLAGSAVAAKAAARKGKKTFTCPTCKAVFASGPMLGSHYKTEPSHRRK